MNYSPKNMYIWDAWYMVVAGELHMYHLQRKRDINNFSLDYAQDCIGHSVTKDLINWEERDICIGPDKNNPIDDLQPWTGCALWHNNKGYFYYTMRGSKTEAKEQAIGLAISDNPNTWKRYEKNPIIIPDTKWYATAQNPIRGTLDCRDLIIVKAPDAEGWHGYYATRQPGNELPETSVIACVYSDDLINWKHLPPAFAPNKYACIEVPDVFFLNGLWYMTCLTGHNYGNRGIFSDPSITLGTIYAVAKTPEGPFYELDENVLVGSFSSAPISTRSFMFEGDRYIMYTDRERTDRNDSSNVNLGSITTPKLLTTDGQYLIPSYSSRIEQNVINEAKIDWEQLKTRMQKEEWGQIWPTFSAKWKFEDNIVASYSKGWSVAPLGHCPESFIFEADVTLNDCAAAGFCIRMEEVNGGGLKQHGAFVALDSEQNNVFFAHSPFLDFVEKRNMEVEQNRKYHLRVVNRLEFVEIYVDNALKLTFNRYKGVGGGVGLFVDRGTVIFYNVRLRELAKIIPQIHKKD